MEIQRGMLSNRCVEASEFKHHCRFCNRSSNHNTKGTKSHRVPEGKVVFQRWRRRGSIRAGKFKNYHTTPKHISCHPWKLHDSPVNGGDKWLGVCCWYGAPTVWTRSRIPLQEQPGWVLFRPIAPCPDWAHAMQMLRTGTLAVPYHTLH